MIKTYQFISKASYVAPLCKSVELRSIGAILNESNYGDPGQAGGTGGWKEDEGDDY